MLHLIIFSLNRAMLLDALLRSIDTHVLSENKNIKVTVLYGCTSKEFSEGYEILKKKFSNKVEFILKEKGKYKAPYNLLLRPRNLYYFFKYPKLRENSKIFNYKELLEQILENSTCNTVAFMTDDSLFFSNVKITQEIISKVIKNPEQNSFSFRHGLNLRKHPGSLKQDGEYLSWNYHEKNIDPHWGYPFSIDGHIYERNFILSFIKRVFYVNPNSFESLVNTFIRKGDFLRAGCSWTETALAGFELNRVQDFSANNNLNIEPETLNDYFLKGFELLYGFDTKMQDFRPPIKALTLINYNTQERVNLI